MIRVDCSSFHDEYVKQQKLTHATEHGNSLVESIVVSQRSISRGACLVKLPLRPRVLPFCDNKFDSKSGLFLDAITFSLCYVTRTKGAFCSALLAIKQENFSKIAIPLLCFVVVWSRYENAYLFANERMRIHIITLWQWFSWATKFRGFNEFLLNYYFKITCLTVCVVYFYFKILLLEIKMKLSKE